MVANKPAASGAEREEVGSSRTKMLPPPHSARPISRSPPRSAISARFDEARRVWADLKKINPRYSFEVHLARLPFRNKADADRIVEGLAKAGLSD